MTVLQRSLSPLFSLVVLGVIAGCGAKSESKPKTVPEKKSVAVFSEENRSQKVDDLARATGAEIEFDASITFDNEYLANNTLQVVKAETDAIRTSKPGVARIILTAGPSGAAPISELDKRLVIKLDVNQSRQKTILFLTGRYDAVEIEDIDQARTDIENRLLIPSLQDLVGGDLESSKILYAKVESALLGLNLRRPGPEGAGMRSKANGLSIVIADRFGVAPNGLALDGKASETALREFAVKALDAIAGGYTVTSGLTARLGFALAVQPLVLDANEYARAIKTLREVGEAYKGTRQIDSLLFGKRTQTSTSTDRASLAKVLVKFDSPKVEILKFLDDMPYSHQEEGRILTDGLRADLQAQGIWVDLEVVVPTTEAAVGELNRLVDAVRATLNTSHVAARSIKKLRLGLSDKHELASGVLSLALPSRDPRTVADFLNSL